jgi:hypothetical protein
MKINYDLAGRLKLLFLANLGSNDPWGDSDGKE